MRFADHCVSLPNAKRRPEPPVREAQAAYLAHADTLPLQIGLQEQALVSAGDVLQRFVSEADDENWNDEVATSVFAALASVERGLAAHKLIASTQEVSG